jgi:hypothetical protein
MIAVADPAEHHRAEAKRADANAGSAQYAHVHGQAPCYDAD